MISLFIHSFVVILYCMLVYIYISVGMIFSRFLYSKLTFFLFWKQSLQFTSFSFFIARFHGIMQQRQRYANVIGGSFYSFLWKHFLVSHFQNGKKIFKYIYYENINICVCVHVYAHAKSIKVHSVFLVIIISTTRNFYFIFAIHKTNFFSSSWVLFYFYY